MVSMEIWAPCTWKAVHIIALGYPKTPNQQDQMNYKDFYMALGAVLPCYKCSVNYKKHIEDLPINNYLDSTNKLFEWTVKLHNIVNKELGKKEITVDEAFKIHTNNMKCSDNNKNYKDAIFITVIVALLLIITALFVQKKK